jgi:hypothetical protein
VGTLVGAGATRVIPDILFFRLVTAALFVISVKLSWDGTWGLVAIARV